MPPPSPSAFGRRLHGVFTAELLAAYEKGGICWFDTTDLFSGILWEPSLRLASLLKSLQRP